MIEKIIAFTTGQLEEGNKSKFAKKLLKKIKTRDDIQQLSFKVGSNMTDIPGVPKNCT